MNALAPCAEAAAAEEAVVEEALAAAVLEAVVEAVAEADLPLEVPEALKVTPTASHPDTAAFSAAVRLEPVHPDTTQAVIDETIPALVHIHRVLVASLPQAVRFACARQVR